MRSYECDEVMRKYIINVLRSVKNDYNKQILNPKEYPDIILLCVMAMDIDNDKEKWTEIGYQLCYEIKNKIESLSTNENDISMLSGFGYECFSVNLYSQRTGRLKQFNESMQDLLYYEMLKKAIAQQYDYECTKSSFYDCISGIAGALYYVLDFDDKDNELRDKAIQSSLDYLIGLGMNHKYLDFEIGNYHIPSEQQVLKDDRVRFPNGIINFGMSHGVAGPLLVLSKAYAKGYRTDNLEKAIYNFFDIYQTFQKKIEGVLYWPGQLSLEEYIERNIKDSSVHYASSWCYGNVGILMGLIQTCRNMDWEKRADFYSNALDAIFSHHQLNYFLVSPGLCHGFSSVLCGKIFFAKIKHKEISFIEEDVEKIILQSESNTREAKAFPDLVETKEGRLEGIIGNYSLLNGVTGIVSVFAEILYDLDYYRTLMLIK